MIQYNMLNVKLSNWQLNKLISEIKNEAKVTLNLSSNLIGVMVKSNDLRSNDEINFLQKLLLTNTQVLTILEAFANGSSANIFKNSIV